MINTVRYHICKVKTHRAVLDIVSGTYVLGQWLFLAKKRQEWDREALSVRFSLNTEQVMKQIRVRYLRSVKSERYLLFSNSEISHNF